jgi:uncharacterized protein involved in exopolysaccharide biosynthesis
MTRALTHSETALHRQETDDRVMIEEAETRATRERTVARVRQIWNRRRLVLRVTAWGLAAATAAAFLIPSRYTSTARLMPPEGESGTAATMLAALSARASGLPAFAQNLLGLKTTGALFIGVLESRTVEDDLVAKFNLEKVYGVGGQEAARKTLAARSAISLDPQTGIITVAVTDHQPRRAAAMAGEYVDELNVVVNQLSTSSAHRERLFLEQRLAQVQQGLESAEKEFSQFASKNTAIDIKEQGRAMVTAAATLQGQLIAAESELEGLRQIYTDRNVRVRALEARVGELKRQLEKLGGKGAGERSGIQSLYPPIRELPVLGVTYADLYRKVKVQEAVFETLTQEYELAKVEEVREIPSVKVLDPANVPEKKSFPPRLLIIFLGASVACAGAVAWVVAGGLWREMDPRDPGKLLAEEVFTTVKANLAASARNGSWMRAVVSRAWLGRKSAPKANGTDDLEGS